MNYDIMTVLRALEAYYVTNNTHIEITIFIKQFCEHYQLNTEKEKHRITKMLQILEKQGKIEIKENKISMFNMLTAGLKLEIGG